MGREKDTNGHQYNGGLYYSVLGSGLSLCAMVAVVPLHLCSTNQSANLELAGVANAVTYRGEHVSS